MALNRVTDQQCVCCGQIKNKIGFKKISNPYYKNGLMPICNQCAAYLLQEYIKKTGNDAAGLWCFLAQLGIPFYMDEWLKIIGALGGLEAIRFTVTFLANRKTNARKEKATADSMELQNLLSIIDNLNKQIERYDERLKQRDEKVDTIYREWRTAQAEAQNWMRKYYELELALKDAEHNRCDRPDSECSRRTPPRRPITINNQNKEESNE